MKKAPTLADRIIRESLRPRGSVNRALGRDLIEAKKFVLNKEASAFLADLSHAAYEPGIKLESKNACLDRARVLSRLPHAMTWIEYDSKEFRRRTLEAYNDMVGSVEGTGLCHQDEVAPAIGWLMKPMQSGGSTFMAVTVVDIVDEITVLPYGICWSTDDTVLRHDAGGGVIQDRVMTKGKPESLRDVHDSELATGIIGYKSQHVLMEFDRDRVGKDEIRELAREFVGELRFIWALLSTINDIPIGFSRIVPTKGYVARGSYRHFVEHTVVNINLPKGREPRVVAKHAVEMSRRRAHQVRGHWRRDWRHPLSPLCAHAFDGDMACTVCGGRRIWIAEHERGDPALGYVTHDYSVTHDEK